MDVFILAGLLTGVDPALISNLCFVESRHDARAYVAMDGNSPSYGLCQLKLSTARDMGFRGKPHELFNPHVSAYYAARYLKWQKGRHGTWEKAVSSYNCGRPCANRRYVEAVFRGKGKQ